MSFTELARKRFLVGGVASLLLLAAMTALVVLAPSASSDLDSITDAWREWTSRTEWAKDVTLSIQAAAGTVPMFIYTAIIAGMLALRRFTRAAGWVVVVMLGSFLTTHLLKVVVDRPRSADALTLLDSPAFPSGHASAMAAATGVVMVLSSVFLRKRDQRRLLGSIMILATLVVGLDRLLLGVHGITDIVAGYALGAAWVLLSAYFFDPSPQPTEHTPLPAVLPRTRKLAVILNPIKVEDIDVFKTLVEALAEKAGWSQPSWHETTVEDPGPGQARQAAEEGAELVIVCGGDGTVRDVCSELAGSGIPVGIVPAGTGNLLARNLALPLHLKSALDVALNGQDQAIDMVRIDGDGMERPGHFLVMAGMGFDAAIMEGVNEELKKKVGWLAYVVSGLRNIFFQPVKLEISVDDAPFESYRARTLVIGNVGFLQGGLPLIPQASIDDGLIDVVLLNPSKLWTWVQMFVRVLTRGKKSDETVARMTGKKIVVRAAHDTPRQIDGDPIGSGREMTCECIHGRLLVRVPR